MSEGSGDKNKVWISVGRTINTGNYESIRVDAGYGKILDEGQSATEGFKEVEAEVLSYFDELLQAVLNPRTQVRERKPKTRDRKRPQILEDENTTIDPEEY